MTVLGVTVTIGYLSMNNYNLRQETRDIANIAERNDVGLNESLATCQKQKGDMIAKVENVKKDLQKVKDEKAKLDADLKTTAEEGSKAISAANDEFAMLQNELMEKFDTISNLTVKLYALDGRTFAMGSSMYTQSSTGSSQG